MIILSVCIAVFAIIFSRLIYEIYYNYQLNNIKKQIYIICKYVNIHLESIDTYMHDNFIRYKLKCNEYKNTKLLISLLEYNLNRKCIIEVDYNYCYIDVQNKSLYYNTHKPFNTLNSLNFINGCLQPLSISLMQHICIKYNSDDMAQNIIKYIQNITMHAQILIYTTSNWNNCLYKIYDMIAERMDIIWPYLMSFNEYIQYNSDLNPIIIIAQIDNVSIPEYLLELMNKVGIFIILLSKTIRENFTVILEETDWKNRFKFTKHGFLTYIEF